MPSRYSLALRVVASVLLSQFMAVNSNAADTPTGPLEPEAARKSLVVAEGLDVELVASEPRIVDPVALAFDEFNRLWVVEMRDYPNGPAPGQKPKSRIKVLLDNDRDGFFETAHTFADELLFATGVLPWKGGVIATLSGRVVWMKDTDGDFKADVVETWFTGFVEQNPQLRANHPTLGPDNWVYIANGLRGGKVINEMPGRSEKSEPIDISNRDFRFDPRTGRAEAITGTGQFGLTFNDFGDRFVCTNRNPCVQIVLEDRYLKRNPFLVPGKLTHDVAPAAELSRLYPLSRAWTTSNLHAHQFTAACGVLFFRGHALPMEYRGNFFTCDPTANLVHRMRPAPREQVLMTSLPDPVGTEFLASRDEWFRPVNLSNGPDGALYVLDMYRAVIEHPEFVPDELKKRPDLEFGTDRGRIWRIVQKGQRGTVPEKWTAQNLVAAQKAGTSGRWHDETLQRLILEEQKPVDGAEGLGPRFAIASLSNEKKADSSTTDAARDLTAEASLAAAILKGMEAPAVVVELQQVLAVRGEELSDEQLQALAVRVLASAESGPLRTAALSSVGTQPLRLLRTLLKLVGPESSSPGARAFIEEAAVIAGSQNEAATVSGVLTLVAESESSRSRSTTSKSDTALSASDLVHERTRWALWRGLMTGLARRGAAVKALEGLPPREHAAFRSLLSFLIAQVGTKEAPREVRLEALRTLAVTPSVLTEQLLVLMKFSVLPVAETVADPELQAAAISVLQPVSMPAFDQWLVQHYIQEGPSMRRVVLDALLARSDRITVLLDALEAGTIARADLDLPRRQRLLRGVDPKHKARADKLLAELPAADRQEVLAAYQPVLKMKGEPARGRVLFEKQCATCHKVADVGVQVGPDISDSRVKTPEQLLVSILDPNRAVDANYFGYAVTLNDGRVLSGLIAEETTTSVVLRQPENKTVSLLRSEIEELRNTGLSLMPVGVEKNLPPQDMADLISFVKNWRYLDGLTPLGK